MKPSVSFNKLSSIILLIVSLFISISLGSWNILPLDSTPKIVINTPNSIT